MNPFKRRKGIDFDWQNAHRSQMRRGSESVAVNCLLGLDGAIVIPTNDGTLSRRLRDWSCLLIALWWGVATPALAGALAESIADKSPISNPQNSVEEPVQSLSEDELRAEDPNTPHHAVRVVKRPAKQPAKIVSSPATKSALGAQSGPGQLAENERQISMAASETNAVEPNTTPVALAPQDSAQPQRSTDSAVAALMPSPQQLATTPLPAQKTTEQPVVNPATNTSIDVTQINSVRHLTIEEAQPMPLPALPLVRWNLDKNSTIRTTLERWAQSSHWNLVWRSELDYSIPTQTTIEASSYTEAAAWVLNQLRNQGQKLQAKFYTQNQTLVVDEW